MVSDRFTIHNECCLAGMTKLAENSIDSFVTDPPYGLSFMGKGWDHGIPGMEFWQAALRIAKPGAYLLAFGGTRTYHRLACAIEDAGWEIRDCLAWCYGSGFPKSLNLTGERKGWGTALKPAFEPIILARKPLTGTVAANVQEFGTGALNIDGCRVGTESTTTIRSGNSGAHGRYGKDDRVFTRENPPGRWPANLIHDGSDEVLELFPQSSGGAWPANGARFGMAGGTRKQLGERNEMADSGSAARFFYCAKASKSDRNEGCDLLEERAATKQFNEGMEGKVRSNGTVIKPAIQHRNNHPTVKPTELMRYLCRLVTPPGGLICDPFTGSGSTGKAALLEGFRFLGFESDTENGYFDIATARCEHASGKVTAAKKIKTAKPAPLAPQQPLFAAFDGVADET